MISYKVKGIILAVIISLASIMMPFSVYADTISASNIHLNTSLISVNYDRTPYFYNYKYEFVFDKEYVGWVSVNVVSTYYSDNNFTTTQSTFQKAIYVNGGTASITNGFYSTGNYASGCLVSASFSIVNSNVIEYGVISSLDDITDILTDVSNYVSIDVLDELENIASNIGLSNTYLNNIDDNLENIDNLIDKISWIDIPVELTYRVNLSDTPTPWNGEIGRLNGYLSFSYTGLRTFDSIIKIYLPVNYGRSLSDIRLYFDNGEDVTDEYLLYITRSRIGVVLYMISETNYGYYGTGTINVKANYNYVYAPSGSNGVASVKYLPSDDIEYWQLKSFFINDKYMNIIANGTTQSNSAASDLESETSAYSDIADDVIGVEEGLTSNFETEVNKIDLNTGLNVFGGNFMTSATWVRTQFDRLTENTPYGSLVVYGLTLGFALLMLGKVFL